MAMAALSRGCKPRRCDWDRKNPDFDIYSQTFKWILMILIQETPNREYFAVTVDLVNILDRNCRLRTLEMSFRGMEISKVCGHPSNYNSTIANWSLLQVVIFKSRKGLFVLWWKLPHAATFLLDQPLGQSTSTSGHFPCQIVMMDVSIPRPSNVRFQEAFFCYRLQCCRNNITECTTEWKSSTFRHCKLSIWKLNATSV